jgi:hypothetical protein
VGHHAGRSARIQPVEAVALDDVQVCAPVAPTAARLCVASSVTWAPVLSNASVHPVGGVTAVDELSIPTPPMTIAPAVVVVTSGTVSFAAE